MTIPSAKISNDYIDKAWTYYQNLLAAHNTEIADLTNKYDFYKDNAFSHNYRNRIIMIDSRNIFTDWCLNTTELFIDLSPETFATVLFWKEYWTFTLLVMSQMFISKMAERLSTKLNEPNWGYAVQIYDGHCDLKSVMVRALKADTGKSADPVMKIEFPSFDVLRKQSINSLETGDIWISYQPDAKQAPVFSVPLYNLGRILKREYIERCDFDIE